MLGGAALFSRFLLLLLLLLLPGAAGSAAARDGTGRPGLPAAAVVTVSSTVRISGSVVATTLDEYLSVDLDWWHNTTHDCAPAQGRSCWGNAGALWLDLDNPRIKAAAAALAPGLLRIGGSLDNYAKYLVGGMSAADCHASFEPVKGQMWPGLCLNMSRWDAIQSFAQQAGLGVVFGLGYPLALAPDEGHFQWDSENALALLQYTARQKHRLVAVELGEENAPLPGTEPFEDMLKAYANLRAGIHALDWSYQGSPPLVLARALAWATSSPGSGLHSRW
eukprot:SAG22_NODE_1431_length_4441_cov_1.510134_2_plen_278_part_00